MEDDSLYAVGVLLSSIAAVTGDYEVLPNIRILLGRSYHALAALSHVLCTMNQQCHFCTFIFWNGIGSVGGALVCPLLGIRMKLLEYGSFDGEISVVLCACCIT